MNYSLSASLAAMLLCGATSALAQEGEATPPTAAPPPAPASAPTEKKDISIAPDNPYPLAAAGWGPRIGSRLFLTRWIEDWSDRRDAGLAPPLKAMPITDTISLTLSAEARARVDAYSNAALFEGNDFAQFESRLIAGAKLSIGDHITFFGELGDAQVEGKSDIFTPNFRGGNAPGNYRNDLAVQQLFVDLRTKVGGTLIGATVGRQEFVDGPRQIISISEGPNLHRSWNGVRLYLHAKRFRLGAFSFKGTTLGFGAFDDPVNDNEKLKGLNASFALLNDDKPGQVFVDPFLYHTYNIRGQSGAGRGEDTRDTYGVRIFGNRGPWRIDWAGFRQTGDHEGRAIDAWAASFNQSVQVANGPVRVRAGARVDLASGGNTLEPNGPIRSFNQLYASVGYLGQGLLISQSNLALITPTLGIAPTKDLTFNLEYALLRRMNRNDAVYAGLMRPYEGTELVSGNNIGSKARMVGTWAINPNLNLDFEVEHLFAGSLLKRAGYPSGGTYGMIGLSFRY